ncbi:unnamed protein product [Polarella glacialis]|uniref:Uncharacterized protein n=1 Tax=Polarella glacialis TaxID=89957 RepID=A0A813GV18_POLGL|nr:unnamed protein product [Polarella glacialis]
MGDPWADGQDPWSAGPTSGGMGDPWASGAAVASGISAVGRQDHGKGSGKSKPGKPMDPRQSEIQGSWFHDVPPAQSSSSSSSSSPAQPAGRGRGLVTAAWATTTTAAWTSTGAVPSIPTQPDPVQFAAGSSTTPVHLAAVPSSTSLQSVAGSSDLRSAAALSAPASAEMWWSSCVPEGMALGAIEVQPTSPLSHDVLAVASRAGWLVPFTVGEPMLLMYSSGNLGWVSTHSRRACVSGWLPMDILAPCDFYEFLVRVPRADIRQLLVKPLGLRSELVEEAGNHVPGLKVRDILPGSLLSEWNARCKDACPRDQLLPGDRITLVQDEFVPSTMHRALGTERLVAEDRQLRMRVLRADAALMAQSGGGLFEMVEQYRQSFLQGPAPQQPQQQHHQQQTVHQSPSQQQHYPPPQQYSPPAQQQRPPPQTDQPPVQQYLPPAQQYQPPAPQNQHPEQQERPPAQQYHSPQTLQQPPWATLQPATQLLNTGPLFRQQIAAVQQQLQQQQQQQQQQQPAADIEVLDDEIPDIMAYQ